MAAEILNRSGLMMLKARGYLNQVRRRRVWDLNHASSGAALTDFIFDRKEEELVGEGHRFFDLVCTKKGGSRNTWIYW
jgi:hypothetical protein